MPETGVRGGDRSRQLQRTGKPAPVDRAENKRDLDHAGIQCVWAMWAAGQSASLAALSTQFVVMQLQGFLPSPRILPPSCHGVFARSTCSFMAMFTLSASLISSRKASVFSSSPRVGQLVLLSTLISPGTVSCQC